MICFPLDNTPYEAKDMGTYLATRTRGVFSSDGNLAVTPGESGLSVSVSPGLAWHKWSDYWGTAALQEQALTLDLDTADGALKRIDAIVCRLDKVNNRAEIVVKKGAPSSAPIVVPPVRDANYDELYIATVLIGAGVISISASAITDQRLNEEYCGLMRDGVTGIPTASLHAQAQQILTELTDALNAQIVRQSAEFDAWFDDLKGKLGEDPATALQLQVDNLNAAAVGDSFKLKGDPISIEAAGANRIDTLTAYGETPQGGTTEAPVALTGVDSAILFEQHTPINLAKPNEGESNGISIIANADGSVTARGTATKDTWPVLVRINIPSSIVSGDITISLSSPASVGMAFQSHSPSGKVENVYLSAGYTSVTTKIKSGYTGMHIFLSLLPDQTIDETFHIMIAQGIEPVPFVPYVEPSVTTLPIPRPLRRVGDVRDVCVTRQEYEGTEKLVVTYNVGFVELDGTEYMTLGNIDASQKVQQFNISNVLSSPKGTDAICSHISSASSVNEESISIYDNRLLVAVWLRDPLLEYGFVAGDSGTYIHAFKAYLAAQKAAGTPVQIAYQLAAPEVYATDPLDIDNAAGPLTVMTGGAVEVRMTELVGSRSPELAGKMDKATYDADGDGVVDKAAAVPWDGVTGKPGTFTPSTHTHDDRYYTETEMNTKLAGKANSSHTHTKDQVGLSKVNNNAISMGYDGNLWINYS